jgi:hypothetical protein
MRFQRSLFSFSNVAPSSSSSRETKTKAPQKRRQRKRARAMQTSLFFRLSSDCRREKRLSWLCISHRRTLQTNSINTKDRRGDFFVSTFLDFLIEGAVFLNTQMTRALHFHWPLFCVYFLHPPPTFIPTFSGCNKDAPPPQKSTEPLFRWRQRLLRNAPL